MIEKREDVAPACRVRGLPEYMIGGVERYLFDHIKPGDFLTAVLRNDLRDAYAYADDENVAAMRGWMLLLHNDFPIGSHGSPEAVAKWLLDG